MKNKLPLINYKNIATSKITSKYETNIGKKNRIKSYFRYLKMVKNYLSKEIFNNYISEIISNKFDVQNDYKLYKFDNLSAWETQFLFQSIIDFYVNQIKQNIINFKVNCYTYKSINKIDKIFDKNKQKYIKNKTIVYENIETKSKLAKLVQYCCKVSNLKEKIENFKLNKDILEQINLLSEKVKEKFFKIVEIKQKTLLKKLNVSLIKFKTGSICKSEQRILSSNEKIKRILKDNKNSKYKYFYALDIQRNKYINGKRKKYKEYIKIPLAYNNKYHKKLDIEKYKKQHYITLNNKNRLNINITYEKDYYYLEDNKPIGLDVNGNFKTTLMFSDNSSYSFDFLKPIIDEIKSIDKKNKKELNDIEKRKLNKLYTISNSKIDNLIINIVKELKQKQITSIVCEELSNLKVKGINKKFKDKDTQIKYNKLFSLLRLSGIKDKFIKYCKNQGIRIHSIPANFTSIYCFKCGHIDKNNRIVQDTFQCCNCNYTIHADYNSSNNILNFFERFSNELCVLKDYTYSPKKYINNNTIFTLLSNSTA